MRASILLLSVIIFTCLLAGCDYTMIMTTGALKEDAQILYDAGDYEDSLKYCDIVCQRKPDDYDTHILRCYVKIELGLNEEALQDVVYAFELCPERTTSLRMRAAVHSANQLHDVAIADYSEVIRREPTDFANYVDRGYEYELTRDYQSAISDYRRALSLNKKCVEAWNNYAYILAAAHEADYRDGTRAKKYAAKAVKLADEDEMRSAAWDTFAVALAELGDFKYAIKAANKALEFATIEKDIDEFNQHIALFEQQQAVRYEPFVPKPTEELVDDGAQTAETNEETVSTDP